MPALYCEVRTLHKRAMITAYVASVTVVRDYVPVADRVAPPRFLTERRGVHKSAGAIYKQGTAAVDFRAVSESQLCPIWVAFTYYAQIAVLLGKDPTLTGRTVDL